MRSYSRNKVILNFILEKISILVLMVFVPRKINSASRFSNILLVEPFQMGDILSLTPLIDPLKKKYPEANIYFFTKFSSGAILEFDSRIKKVLFSDFPWTIQSGKKNNWRRVIHSMKFAYGLRKYNFDLGIDTRGDIRSQILLVLAGCKSRLGYTNYLNSNIKLSGHLLTHRRLHSSYYHRYEWNLDLLKEIGFVKSEIFPVRFPSFLPDKLPKYQSTGSGYLVIHVGGGWEFRRWANAKWIKLIDQFQSRIEGDKIFVIGGPAEAKLLNEIELGINNKDRVNFKQTSFDELTSLIQGCKQFIGLDSGPMNLAVCLNKPTLALFGPGDELMWRPLNSHGKFIKKSEKFPCSPCLQLNCIFPKKNCMEEIEVEDVLNKLKF